MDTNKKQINSYKEFVTYAKDFFNEQLQGLKIYKDQGLTYQQKILNVLHTITITFPKKKTLSNKTIVSTLTEILQDNHLIDNELYKFIDQIRIKIKINKPKPLVSFDEYCNNDIELRNDISVGNADKIQQTQQKIKNKYEGLRQDKDNQYREWNNNIDWYISQYNSEITAFAKTRIQRNIDNVKQEYESYRTKIDDELDKIDIVLYHMAHNNNQRNNIENYKKELEFMKDKEYELYKDYLQSLEQKNNISNFTNKIKNIIKEGLMKRKNPEQAMRQKYIESFLGNKIHTDTIFQYGPGYTITGKNNYHIKTRDEEHADIQNTIQHYYKKHTTPVFQQLKLFDI